MNEEIKGKSVRNRGKNFHTREIQLLTELVEKKYWNHKQYVTNDKKMKIWENITIQINVLGLAKRKAKEIKTKWINMHQTAKKNTARIIYIVWQTGGGPFPKPKACIIDFGEICWYFLRFAVIWRLLGIWDPIWYNHKSVLNICLHVSEAMIHKKIMFILYYAYSWCSNNIGKFSIHNVEIKPYLWW